MSILAPSIYAADYMNLQAQVRILETSAVDWIHVDVMDGHFVPNMAFGSGFVKTLRANTKLKLDVHLMIDQPERMVNEFIDSGADTITIHYEASRNPEKLLNEIHAAGVKSGIVLKPETSLDVLTPDMWDIIDVLQIMTVQPGMNGQHFIDSMLDKISDAYRRIKEHGKDICIEVDGNITKERLPQVLSAGAEIIVVGKAIFSGDMEKNIREYVSIMKENNQLI